MYVSPGEKNALVMSEPIPVGTILNCKYYYKYFTYANYNGIEGWIVDIRSFSEKSAKVASQCDLDIITIEKASLYEFPKEDSKIIKEIPENTEFKVNYSFDYGYDGEEGFAQVHYDEQKGWINFNDCMVYHNEESNTVKPYKKTVRFIEDVVVNDELTLKKDDIIEFEFKYHRFYNDDYYLTHNNYGLWWNDFKNSVEIIEDKNLEISSDNFEENIDESGNVEEIDIDENVNIEENEEAKNIRILPVSFFVIGGVLVCIGIIVVISKTTSKE